MVFASNTRRVLLSVASRVFCNMETRLQGRSIQASKSGQRRKTMHCGNCFACPLGAQRNRGDCPCAQSLRKGRKVNYATGGLAKCRICGDRGRPNIRRPATQAKLRPKRRIHHDTRKIDGMSSRGRNAPPPHRSWRPGHFKGHRELICQTLQTAPVSVAPIHLRQALPQRRKKISLRKRAVRKRDKYSGISVQAARARLPVAATADARPVSGRASLTNGLGAFRYFYVMAPP